MPGAPINGYAEALADPQAQHLGLVQPMTMAGGTDTRTVVCPVRIDGAAVPVDTRAPALGEHDRELRERARRGAGAAGGRARIEEDDR